MNTKSHHLLDMLSQVLDKRNPGGVCGCVKFLYYDRGKIGRLEDWKIGRLEGGKDGFRACVV